MIGQIFRKIIYIDCQRLIMFRILLKSKIHRAVVTGSDLNYVESITIDKNLLENAGIREIELVQVGNINNGPVLKPMRLQGKQIPG